METTRTARRTRLRAEDVILSLLCTVTGPLLWWFGRTASPAVSGGGSLQAVESLTGTLCAAAGAVIAAWWALALLGTACAVLGDRLSAVRMARWGRAVSPAFLRRTVSAVLGINLLIAPGAWAQTETTLPEPSWQQTADQGSPASTSATTTPAPPTSDGPAHATPSPATPPSASWSASPTVPSAPWPTPPAPTASPSAAPEVPRSSPSRAPSPDWQPPAPSPTAPGTPRTDRDPLTAPRTATVRDGDCLWDLAEEELGPYATDLEIDLRWRRWHEHNRAVIGEDPSLLRPGTVLTAPPLD